MPSPITFKSLRVWDYGHETGRVGVVTFAAPDTDAGAILDQRQIRTRLNATEQALIDQIVESARERCERAHAGEDVPGVDIFIRDPSAI